jgi:Ser/Thr protein kinase RdoA (MazF antagonist)
VNVWHDRPVTLTAFVREAFGFDDASVEPGPRGAMGRIWRVEFGGSRYALKETFHQPPSEELVATEAAFTRRAAALGVQAPTTHPDRAGRRLVPGPGGGWLRLYDWVDVRPLDPFAPDTPRLVGELLARLHVVGPPCVAEVGGGRPDLWYERAPSLADFAAARASAAPWAPRLTARLTALPELTSMVTPVDLPRLVLCHRDLHPGNVLADESDGSPVVLDWDNLGPADPSREVAAAMFDWWCDPSPDVDAMQAMYSAYVGSGGPGRVTAAGNFTMLICTRLNFLLVQVRAALDDALDPEHRAWAEQEIDESLRIAPTPEQIAAVLAALRH